VRIAVTGKTGQVVQCLLERGVAAGVEVVAVGRPELDIIQPATLLPVLEAARPDVVVNAAAITAVDDAEADPVAATTVNADGAGHVAAAAARLGVPVIQISTDYVFDGTAGRAYVESDAPSPLSVYGVSKLAGEQAVADANPQHLILRTAWVYSPFGDNFVRTILERAGNERELAIVADQWGSPTSGLDLADGILHAATRLHEGQGPHGTFHLAGTGSINRSGQARYILAVSLRSGGPYATVRDVAATPVPGRASRPANSSLSSAAFATAFGWTMPDWQVSTQAVVERLVTKVPVV
jgi:dTDP-4-dehydrorhamnose reductase